MLMRKLLLFALSLALLLTVYSPASASGLIESKEELEAAEKEIEQIDQQIRELPEDQREPTINQKIQLVMKKNKIQALIHSYELLLNPGGSTGIAGTTLTASDIKAAQMIPAKYLPMYEAAGEKYGVDWSVLASIHKIETQFSGINLMVSTAGAIGHMQFMPATFKSYGVDGNGNGTISAWEVEDAIFSAANYLAASGYKQDPKKAVWAYNHADWYVEEVLSVAATFKASFTSSGGSSVAVVEAGKKLVNKTSYVFGGGRNQSDINRGYFDCSSFVHWAFKQVGQDLGPLTSVTTDTLKKLGKEVDPADMQPGDLVFFDTYKIDGHIGIYAGNGMFLGAQESTGVAMADMKSGYWAKKFNGRVKRL